MKVLITGASGFIGSYVAEQLSAEGHQVRVLVRPRSDKRILEKLPGVEFANGSIEDRPSLDEALKGGVDAVIHAAGVVKARTPEEFHQVNAEGTKSLLAAALGQAGIK